MRAVRACARVYATYLYARNVWGCWMHMCVCLAHAYLYECARVQSIANAPRARALSLSLCTRYVYCGRARCLCLWC